MRTTSPPGTCSPAPRVAAARPCARSTPWACATRSRSATRPPSGELWFADHGPDATLADPTRPGRPREHDPHEQARQLRLAVLLRARAPYGDWDYVAGASRGFYDCGNLVNNSPNNLTPPANSFVNPGLLDIPDATARTIVVDLQRRLAHDPVRGPVRRRRDGRPEVHLRREQPSTSKFPQWFDGRYFFFDWTTDWVATAAFNGDGSVKDHKFFLPLHTFVKPMDMQFGADGALYVLAVRQRLGREQRRHGPVPRHLRRRQPPSGDQGERGQGLRRHAADGQLRRLRLVRPGRRRAHLQLGLDERRHGRRHRRQGQPHVSDGR